MKLNPYIYKYIYDSLTRCNNLPEGSFLAEYEHLRVLILKI